ncbi:MAG: domain S-box, partial [Planctomycetaceae bacterium]|nr:domain S-box [Planctomycetaceae bacterium]
INDILDIAKIEAGKLDFDWEMIEIPFMIEDIRETVQPLAERNSNILDVIMLEQLRMIHADYTKLNQCLLNLVSNACKFTQDGRVTLSVAQETIQESEWNTFRVKDPGIGLTDEQASRLFQPFTQTDASTTRKFGGTGLGLAITKKLCEAMGGTIRLKSQIGEGSTFTIQLPVFQEKLP